MKLLTITLALLFVGAAAVSAGPQVGLYSFDSYTGDGVTSVLKADFAVDTSGGGVFTGSIDSVPFSNGTYSNGDITFTFDGANFGGTEGFALVGFYAFSGGQGASWLQSDGSGLVGTHTLTNTLGAGFATARLTITSAVGGVFAGHIGEPESPDRPITGTYNEATMTWTMLDDIVGGINYTGTYGYGWAGTWKNDDTQVVGTFQVVPEPGSIVALMGGLAGFGGMFLRRRQ